MKTDGRSKSSRFKLGCSAANSVETLSAEPCFNLTRVVLTVRILMKRLVAFRAESNRREDALTIRDIRREFLAADLEQFTLAHQFIGRHVTEEAVRLTQCR